MKWAGRQRNILDYTLSSLFRRKVKNLSLLVVYTLVVFILSSVVFFTQSVKEEAALLLRDSPEIVVQRLVAGRHDLIPVRYMETIRAIRGVIAVEERLWGYYFDPASGFNYTLVADPRFPHERGEVTIGSGVARSLVSSVGGTMPVTTHDGKIQSLRIREVFPAESEVLSAGMIRLSRDDFVTIFGLPEGHATDLALKVRNIRERSTIAAKITQLLPDTRPLTKEEMQRTYDAVFDWRGGMVIIVLSCAVMAFIILAWDKATGLSAEEKKEIGILKAVGWETSDVLQMKFWEGAVISLASFFIGVALAYAHIYFTSASLFAPALKGWSVLYPPFRLIPRLSPYQVSTLFFLIVVPYTVATIVPSWRAATVDPDTVMRG